MCISQLRGNLPRRPYKSTSASLLHKINDVVPLHVAAAPAVIAQRLRRNVSHKFGEPRPFLQRTQKRADPFGIRDAPSRNFHGAVSRERVNLNLKILDLYLQKTY